MVSAAGQAVFAVVAKDAASKVIHGIGKSFGSLQSKAGSVLKGIAAGALAVGAALGAMAVAGIKGAIEDERATVKLNAALKQRGFNLDTLQPKIQEQIKAMQHLGVSDDEVRAGLEVGSRFFKKQGDLLKSNAAAANVSAVTGKSLADVQMIIGKATQGQMRGLKSLGIDLKKGATLTQILTEINKKYGGTAEALANTTSGKMAEAQLRFNEAMESFGYHILPAVNTALDFLSANVLPVVETAFDSAGKFVADFISSLGSENGIGGAIAKLNLPDFGKTIGDVAAKFGPLFDSVKKLFGALWGDGNGALAFAVKMLGQAFDIAFQSIGVVVDALKWLVDNATAIINILSATGYSNGANGNTGAGGNYGGMPSTGATSPYLMGGSPVNVTITATPDWMKFQTTIDNGLGKNIPTTPTPRYYTPGQ